MPDEERHLSPFTGTNVDDAVTYSRALSSGRFKERFEYMEEYGVGALDSGEAVNYLGFNIVFLTQEQYDAMDSHSNGTLYFIGSNTTFDMEDIVRITEAEFEEITPDNNTIYLITQS